MVEILLRLCSTLIIALVIDQIDSISGAEGSSDLLHVLLDCFLSAVHSQRLQLLLRLHRFRSICVRVQRFQRTSA